jgi:hypothetical protein
MLINEFKRLAAWLMRPHHPVQSRPIEKAVRPESVLEFDPAWHGDHWQNLLSAPMDARHYVMEDWTSTVAPTFEASRAALSGAGRSTRRSRR